MSKFVALFVGAVRLIVRQQRVHTQRELLLLRNAGNEDVDDSPATQRGVVRLSGKFPRVR